MPKNIRIPSIRFSLWWPALPGDWRAWLPSRGNVLFTLLVVAGLLWATNAGALPLRAPAAAGTSTGTIAYQGRLADSAGSPLTGTYNMIFRLYDVPTGGAPLWEEQWTGSNGVRVSDGLFNVMLGSLTSIPQSLITGHESLFLGITVGTDDEMTPRVQLGSVPFAVQALTVPDGSITTTKIADGAVTSDKLGVRLPELLGHKTCDNCGAPTESNLYLWNPVKGANSQDIIEVTETTQGGAIIVHMTGRYKMNQAGQHWCGIAVLQGASQIRLAHLDGDTSVPSSDFGCSGTYVFTDLPAGTYTFRAMAFVNPGTTVQWVFQRQIVVYEF